MKLLAQVGYGRGNKVDQGLQMNLIDGFILSPKDETPDRARALFALAGENHAQSYRLLDPQLYIMSIAPSERLNPGRLLDYEFYPTRLPRRRELFDEKRIAGILKPCLAYQREIGTSAIIAPNVLVQRSLDSMWGAIARNFIRISGQIAQQNSERLPILATLALDSNAMAQRREIEELLTELTGSDAPPNGFYVIVSFPEIELKNCLTSDIFANWLYLVFSLKVNGFEVVVGYSDFLTPFFGIAGARAGASGWWENLRKFSIGRFLQDDGVRRQPLLRYSSPRLLNRILVNEMFSSRMESELKSEPDYLREYKSETGVTPTEQVLQHWAAIRNVIKETSSEDIESGIDAGLSVLERANSAYARLRDRLTSLDPKSDEGILSVLQDGLRTFRRLIA